MGVTEIEVFDLPTRFFFLATRLQVEERSSSSSSDQRQLEPLDLVRQEDPVGLRQFYIIAKDEHTGVVIE